MQELYGGGTKLGASKNTWFAFLKAYSEEVPRGNLTYREFVSQAAQAYKLPPMKPTERKYTQESKYDAPAKRVRRSQNMKLPTIAQMRAELGRMGTTIPKAKKAPMYLALQTAYRGSTPAPAKRASRARVRSQNLRIPPIAEMKRLLKQQGIKGYSKLKKDQLFALLTRETPVASTPRARVSRSMNLNIPTVAQLRELLREQGHTVSELKALKKKDLYDLYQLYFEEDMGDFGEDDYYEELPEFAFNFGKQKFGNEDEAYSSNTNKELRNMIAYRGITPYKGAKNKTNLVSRLIYNDETGKGF